MIFLRGYFADSYKIREGCPIIQNGKLVGAVTHVLVANPTEGYGIFILLANITVFTVALRAMLRKRSVRGAICAHSLTSILVDSLRLIIENMLNAAQDQVIPKSA